MVTVHNLGFPRIGPKREMKNAVERYWKGEIDREALYEAGKRIRHSNWEMQKGLDLIPAGDFSWYDHVLDMSLMLGAIPSRFGPYSEERELEIYFQMARGGDVKACNMTKWFDTNYHYIVPELGETFKLCSQKLFREVEEAKALGYAVKPVILGPLSYLWLAKGDLRLLDALVPVYQEILSRLQVNWVQIDEPILVLDLPRVWQEAFFKVYQQLQGPQILLATYFGSVGELACQLPVTGLHIDIVRGAEIPKTDKILSVGIIDGRNIWKADLRMVLSFLKPLYQELGDRLWIAPSCSLLHCPVDVRYEKEGELKGWLAFAREKIEELKLLKKGLVEGIDIECDAVMEARRTSKIIHRPFVQEKCRQINDEMTARAPYPERAAKQETLGLPKFPTTTIGSFPQTHEIRSVRHALKTGAITFAQYEEKIREQIRSIIEKQEKLGLDVLVHGEAERNDMVEFFAEQLEGFAITENGWVQSYGSRCVKPPIIYGDVHRTSPMTLSWILYAQSLTKKPVKGMLTGPVTLLHWSFRRDDLSFKETAEQIALALRCEVQDLEEAGIRIIQIDEPAFREALPLKRKDWDTYLHEAVRAFKIASSGVQNQTQIQTHMCYSDFNDIIQWVAALDADVLMIESSRSNMELLKAFETFRYPNSIGPGVYDIHSPRVPSVEEIVHLLQEALKYISPQQLWINPDCGLKTREWREVESSLRNMVLAAQLLRVN